MRYGWLVLWALFLGIGILGTPAAAPSSMEGLLYSRLPLSFHLLGLPEVTLQTLGFSVLLFVWVRKRLRKRSGTAPPRKAIPRALQVVAVSMMVAAFAYMGYAVGALAGLFILSLIHISEPTRPY